MIEKAKMFQSSAKGLKNNSKFRFLITAKTNDNYKGATIYHYKKGRWSLKTFNRVIFREYKRSLFSHETGPRLWNNKTLKEKTTETPQQSCIFGISASDSTESKSKMLDIEASLNTSFLFGLIAVRGSAQYLNDEKKFKNQSRVTFQYKATTNFKELLIENLPWTPNRRSLATHVVTGILYGANSFFVFDSEKLENSEVQKIEDSMQAVINKIYSLNIEGKVDIKLTDEEKALTNTFSSKFFGDFILESNPATFQDAVQTYTQLPKLLGTNGENSVPVKVWLMPLKSFDPEAAKLMTEISIGLVMKAQDVLEHLKETQMRCNDSLEDKVVKSFPVLHEELSTFFNLCVTFNHEKLNKWLSHKEREINVISPVSTPWRERAGREVLASGVEDVLCFVFTSMLKGDIYLDEMADFLKSPKLGSTRRGVFGQRAEDSSKFRFLITAKTNDNYKGATIYHYKKGRLVTEDFQPLIAHEENAELVLFERITVNTI
ncbi:hypothetical protein F7725_013786 [Dissostichus mawsoni]|uniref:SNTX thioredoxin-like domain-containing protein n=1 Tax=Dissostichus mawsoni TaxID=36200 RepID=A0A7J5YY99_DISMA|nr:hypothetical protein F7725_013786 [Dissostichus mawsoni]